MKISCHFCKTKTLGSNQKDIIKIQEFKVSLERSSQGPFGCVTLYFYPLSVKKYKKNGHSFIVNFCKD